MHWPLFFTCLFMALRIMVGIIGRLLTLAAFALFLLAFALPWVILGA